MLYFVQDKADHSDIYFSAEKIRPVFSGKIPGTAPAACAFGYGAACYCLPDKAGINNFTFFFD
jgi:hypothetical protein